MGEPQNAVRGFEQTLFHKARDLIVIGQKSGVLWALDPDSKGKILWQTANRI